MNKKNNFRWKKERRENMQKHRKPGVLHRQRVPTVTSPRLATVELHSRKKRAKTCYPTLYSTNPHTRRRRMFRRKLVQQITGEKKLKIVSTPKAVSLRGLMRENWGLLFATILTGATEQGCVNDNKKRSLPVLGIAYVRMRLVGFAPWGSPRGFGTSLRGFFFLGK